MAVRYKIRLNPDFENLRQFVDAIPNRNEELGEIIYKARNTVFNNTETGIPLCIKSFKIPPIYNRIAYTFLRKGKARRSFENAERLIALGFMTPTPVAYLEVYKNGLLERSYYISLMIDAEHVRVWQERPNSQEIALNLANLMYRLHCAHVWHRDFSPGNVLYDKDGNYYLIDINRMQFGVKSMNRLLQNFTRLNESQEETIKLVKQYAQISGISNPQKLIDKVIVAHSKFWRNLHEKCRRREEKNRKKQTSSH